MQRWRSGPTHGIANPKPRQFESDPLLQQERPYVGICSNIFCLVLYRCVLHLLPKSSCYGSCLGRKCLGCCGIHHCQRGNYKLHCGSLVLDPGRAGCILWHLGRHEIQKKQRIMEDDAAGMVLRLALKTRFS